MNLMDAASFTAVRLISGAIILLIIFSVFGKRKTETKPGNWLSAFFLFAYAICFSFAYNYLTTGMGALILFGCVQATMLILTALVKGERPRIFGMVRLARRARRAGLSRPAGFVRAAAFRFGFDGGCRYRVGILHASRQNGRRIRWRKRRAILSAPCR